MVSHPIAHIDLSALRSNLERVKALAPTSTVMAMIKANGYGHGLLRVASALSQADYFGVARLQEALSLHPLHFSQPAVVMKGFADAEELNLMSRFKLHAAIHTFEQIDLLEQMQIEEPITVWVKIDTGMHRLGFPPHAIKSVTQRLSATPNVKKPLRFMTHFAQSEEPDYAPTERQAKLFQQVVDASQFKSLANSAAIIRSPEYQGECVRPGIMLYGVSPFPRRIGEELNLAPVMTLTAGIVAIQDLHKGDKVGYGGTWTCPENMRVGVIAIGYGDGYPRHAKNGTPVLVNGICCPLVGRVSMDLITVDLRPCPHAKIGDIAVLWGKGLPVEKIALFAETIAYELLTRVAARVEFKEHEDET